MRIRARAGVVKTVSALVVTVFAVSVQAADLPANAKTYIPVLNSVLATSWPDILTPGYIGGQIEQETCPSLTSKKCWSPHAELKTYREYGFGLGQLTLTYNKDGSERFNTFKDVQALDKSLKGWKFSDRFDPDKQIRALVALDKSNWNKITGVADPVEHFAMTFVSYNAGPGRVLSDRRLCKAESTPKTPCDPDKWFGNVEHHSFLKTLRAASGYSKTFFQTSREYPDNIINKRSPKYHGLILPKR